MTKKRRKLKKRQKVRKCVIFTSFALLPITMFYFSPVLIIQGALKGIIVGSFLVFGAQFLASLFLGRVWCGWLCPAGGLQEICMFARDKRAGGGRYNWIKYFIWVPWLGAIAFAFIKAGGIKSINPLYKIEHGITVLGGADSIMPMFFFLLVIAVVAMAAGRRGFCHYLCWMAPFMVVGRKIRNRFNWPSLRLEANRDECIDCKRCTEDCPMSLDVNGMVDSGLLENPECIMCGASEDTCPKSVISYAFKRSD